MPETDTAPFYNPPYTRPIEDELAWHLVKYLHPDATRLDYQAEITTPLGPCWVDFLVVQKDGRKIAFEISEAGEESRLRDALVMAHTQDLVLYRFRHDDVLRRLHHCLQCVAGHDPALFTPRGTQNIATLADPPEEVEVKRLAEPADWMEDYQEALKHYAAEVA